MKYFELDGMESYCYAKNYKSAYKMFKVEYGDVLFSDIKIISEDTVIYAYDLIGIGGYETLEIYALVRNKEEEQFFGTEEDIKEYIEWERVANDF